MELQSTTTFALCFSLLLLACGSSTKKLGKGSFERAISKAVKALQKDPTDAEELAVLHKAFAQSRDQSLATIARLMEQQNGESLARARAEYIRLERDVHLVNSLPPSLSEQFDLVNYAPKIEELTIQASDMLFDESQLLMKSPVKEDHRLAYDKLTRVHSINPQYPDIRHWITEAEDLAITKILINIRDQTPYRFKDTLSRFLEKEKLASLNKDKWRKYTMYSQERHDGEIKITIHKIGIEKNSPETRTHNYSKEIEIPEYVLDENGNVKKDADGNDVKIIKKKSITCEVIEEEVEYDVVLRGTISYLDFYTNAEVDSEELLSSKTITRMNYQVNGDEQAIDQRMRSKMDNHKGDAMPKEKELVAQQMDTWKKYVVNKISQSKRMFK